MISKPLHEYWDDRTGQKRKAQVYENGMDYDIHLFIDNVFQGIRKITGHAECYAEDAAENYVLGLYDRP